MAFEEELRSAINRTSQENGSNTPDWILAQYLLACLNAWNAGVSAREVWYGRQDPAKCGPLGDEIPDPEGTISTSHPGSPPNPVSRT